MIDNIKKIFQHKGIKSKYTLLPFLIFISVVSGCSSCCWNPDDVSFVPLAGVDWPVSTPEQQGLDSNQVAELYCRAAGLDTIQSLLVIKNGYLVAEKYFHDGDRDRKERLQSVTKSINSAIVGIAIEEGYIDSVDQYMLDFYPEIAGSISDPRKKQITVRQMLQMRTGYPWEESDPALWNALLTGVYPPLLESIPLVNNPGTAFHYSNLTADWLGIIVDRQTGMNLKTYAGQVLFSPLGIEAGDWGTDAEGHNNGAADLFLTARDAAKFGLLYLNDGVYNGEQVVPAQWVQDSLDVYSEDAWAYRVGWNFRDIRYGYQWWSVRAGEHRYNLAWGHGGQQIAILHDLNVVIVLTSYPFFLEHNDKSWKYEKANLNLVADFISKLPAE